MEPLLFSSHRLRELVKQLYTQISSDCLSLFDRPLILIPHLAVKEWIQLECVQMAEQKAILGWKFAHWQQGISLLAPSLPVPSRADLVAALWTYSKKSPRPEWTPFLGSDRKRLDLVEQCASYFYDYSLYGPPKKDHWQTEVFRDLFAQHSWKTLAEALETAAIQSSRPVYFFGLDWIPPAVYRFYLRHPRLRIFRFSPTAMFWEDVRSHRERKGLLKHAPQSQREALDSLLRQEHAWIANWGVLGRNMVSVMGDLESLDNYELSEEPSTLLQHIQCELLTLETAPKTADDSIRLLQAGSSRLREVEILRNEILRSAADGIPFSEMRVYAPDIAPYAPLIEFVFSDIPFRIGSIDLARQSSYFQALERLCKLVSGRWEASEWSALLDTKAFGWQKEDIAQIKRWLAQGAIRWGVDRSHQAEITLATVEASPSGVGTWEDGFDRLIDSWIFFDPEAEFSLSWSDADLFEAFQALFSAIRTTVFSWRTERTLAQWAEEIESFAKKYLTADESLEEDTLAKNRIAEALATLRSCSRAGELFPFAFVERHLFAPSKNEGKSSQLHGVRCLSLEMGSVLPARALFLLGMDEESFPRPSTASSLHLLKKEGVYIPQSGDIDRYLFLQTIFAAKERLSLIYMHQSKKDGKNVSPSLLIQELGLKIAPIAPPALNLGLPLPGSLFSSPMQGAAAVEKTISIRTLKNWLGDSFKYYLERIVGLSFKEEVDSKWAEFEVSYLVRHFFLSDALREPIETVLQRHPFPPGLIGEEMQRQFAQRARDMQAQLQEWNIHPSSIQTIPFRLSLETVTLIGEAPHVIPTGSLHLGDPKIGKMLKYWPEHLCALVATNTSRIYQLRSGKELVVADPKQALQALVELYLRFGESPLFLHPDWAESMLCKNRPVEPASDDRILQWTLARSPMLDLEQEQRQWTPLLQTALAPLIALFNPKGADANV